MITVQLVIGVSSGAASGRWSIAAGKSAPSSGLTVNASSQKPSPSASVWVCEKPSPSGWPQKLPPIEGPPMTFGPVRSETFQVFAPSESVLTVL
ncbi:hypothetical protein DSECCO2_378070 [anaerobic digester metagenome]